MQTPPFHVSFGEIQETQMNPKATIARSMARRALRRAVSLKIDERRRSALELAAPPRVCQIVTIANNPAPNPRNHNSLGNCSEPVNPEVGAALFPGGPVMTARTRAATTHTPRRRAVWLVARLTSCVEGAARTGAPVRFGPGRVSVSGPVEVMPPSRAAHPGCPSAGRAGA